MRKPSAARRLRAIYIADIVLFAALVPITWYFSGGHFLITYMMMTAYAIIAIGSFLLLRWAARRFEEPSR